MKVFKDKSTCIPVLLIIVAIITIIVTIVIAKYNQNGENSPEISIYGTTKEEDRITKETIEKYININVEGYDEEKDDQGIGDVIVIKITNPSEEKISLAISIVAEDEEGKILDTTALYAESIEPGQTQKFRAFGMSELTPDQLKTAKYKIYKALTY